VLQLQLLFRDKYMKVATM